MTVERAGLRVTKGISLLVTREARRWLSVNFGEMLNIDDVFWTNALLYSPWYRYAQEAHLMPESVVPLLKSIIEGSGRVILSSGTSICEVVVGVVSDCDGCVETQSQTHCVSSAGLVDLESIKVECQRMGKDSGWGWRVCRDVIVDWCSESWS